MTKSMFCTKYLCFFKFGVYNFVRHSVCMISLTNLDCRADIYQMLNQKLNGSFISNVISWNNIVSAINKKCNNLQICKEILLFTVLIPLCYPAGCNFFDNILLLDTHNIQFLFLKSNYGSPRKIIK